MGENLRLMRPYLVLLAVFTLGRWLMGTFEVPYLEGTGRFSIVVLTLLSAAFYGIFCRRWRGMRLLQAIGLSALLGVVSQLVILAATLLAYGLDISTYFNHPIALNSEPPVSFARMIGVRLIGLVANPVQTAIAGSVGWALGALLPEK